MFTLPTSRADIGNSRLIYPMTLWEYSPRPCSMTCKMEKRHSRSYAVSRKQSYAVLWVPPLWESFYAWLEQLNPVKRSKLEKAVIYAKTIKKHCVIIFRMDVAKYRIMQRNHCLFKAKDTALVSMTSNKCPINRKTTSKSHIFNCRSISRLRNQSFLIVNSSFEELCKTNFHSTPKLPPHILSTRLFS